MRPAPRSRSSRRRRSPRASAWTLAGATLCAALVYALPAGEAAAKPNVKRKGGQAEVTFGGSLCIPSAADCGSADDVVGKTGPGIGLGVTLGYRPHRSFFFGAAYNLGFFNPDYRLTEPLDANMLDIYKNAYQNSVFGVLRGILPLWRFDLGIELAPGWSRQTFNIGDAGYRIELDSGEVVSVTKEYSQGFALKTAPVIDIYITRQLFLGAKLDFIWNFHGKVCFQHDEGSTTTCYDREGNQASVHQMIFGLHIGGTF
ncbi:MAG: hypothetical protein KC468_09595 [Myxococcales bacterium]|nr:hypothetical protein [Myxococcales bacterium]